MEATPKELFASRLRALGELRRPEILPVLDRLGALHIMHPHFERCFQTLAAECAFARPADVIAVAGPTGCGKTTLIAGLRQTFLREQTFGEAQSTHALALFIEAPCHGGSFNWKDFFQRALEAAGDPSAYDKPHTKSASVPCHDPLTIRLNMNPSSSTYRRALEIAIVARGTRYLVIDEAQHILRVTRDGSVRSQLDILKSIANLTGVVVLLFGTYELAPLFDSNAQLNRRIQPFHMPRYKATVQSERAAFMSILATYDSILEPLGGPRLVEHGDLLLAGTEGCIGELKKWLTRWLRQCACGSTAGLSVAGLETCRKNPAQLRTLHEEIIEGETAYSGLLPTVNASKESAPAPNGASPTARRKPGKRNPGRDPIGT